MHCLYMVLREYSIGMALVGYVFGGTFLIVYRKLGHLGTDQK